MLRDLQIKNLVLMQSCAIEFPAGLNILTGETGSGKTAILHAIRLLLGQRFDPALLRWGEEKGSIQATFSVESQELLSLLSENGIETEDGTLILYREVSKEGKGKNCINDRRVTLSFLQEVGAHLVQVIDQNSQHELRTLGEQRLLLDLYASLEKKVEEFALLFTESKKKKELLLQLEQRLSQKQREWDFCLTQQKELESLPWKEGEEEALFQEYSLFSRSQEMQSKTNDLLSLLSDGPHNVLITTRKAKNLCQNLASAHPFFEESANLLNNSILSVEETIHILSKGSSLFETNPKRHQYLEEKLSAFAAVKKKYGATPAEWISFKRSLEAKIQSFISAEEELESTTLALKDLEKELEEKANNLTLCRKEAAQRFSSLLKKELCSLNMDCGQLIIEVQKTERSKTGEDAVSFWLEANAGEGLVGVKESASGGELSRLLLAIKLCLAEKNKIPTLIFDEIDSNVGGETATLIGEKLKKLSSHCQVICITHFAQVAQLSTSHLFVEKVEQEGRTFSTITALDAKKKQRELLRMLGGKNTF